MTSPPLRQSPPDAEQSTSRWRTRIVQILAAVCAYPDPAAEGQGWIPAAADALTAYLNTLVDDTLAAADAAADTERRLLTAQLDRLRDAVRDLLADLLTGTTIDRGQANALLAEHGIDTLPTTYTVTLTATLAVEVIADAEEHAVDLATDLLAEMTREQEAIPVEVTGTRIDSAVEHDDPPEPIHLRPAGSGRH
jgi:hypothetical protein